MTSTRPATPASDASNASFTCSSGKFGPSSSRSSQAARAHVVEQHRQRHRRVLGAVHRPGEELLAAVELAEVEVEPLAGRRNADDHAGAAAAGEAQRASPSSPGCRRRRAPGRRRRERPLHQLLQPVGVVVCVAPSSRASSSRASSGSTTTIASAPAIRAPWTQNWPTPPAPITSTVARLDARGEQHRPDAGHRRAAEQCRLLERDPATQRQRERSVTVMRSCMQPVAVPR